MVSGVGIGVSGSPSRSFGLPSAALELRRAALARARRGGRPRVAAQALAVDAHRGGDDQPADRGLISASSSTAVPRSLTADIVGDLVHALPDAHRGGQVDDRVHAVQRPPDGHRVANVAADKLDFVAK